MNRALLPQSVYREPSAAWSVQQESCPCSPEGLCDPQQSHAASPRLAPSVGVVEVAALHGFPPHLSAILACLPSKSDPGSAGILRQSHTLARRAKLSVSAICWRRSATASFAPRTAPHRHHAARTVGASCRDAALHAAASAARPALRYGTRPAPGRLGDAICCSPRPLGSGSAAPAVSFLKDGVRAGIGVRAQRPGGRVQCIIWTCGSGGQ